MRAQTGQTSIELLLVLSFVIVVALAIVSPYIENQNKTNAAYVAKLTLLPFVEKNGLSVKINHVIPQVTLNGITVHITTSGTWDAGVRREIQLGVNNHPSGCMQVCTAVKNLGTFNVVTIDWQHTSLSGGSSFFCPNSPVVC